MDTDLSTPLLDVDTVISYLVAQGVLTGADARAEALGGGVSNVVLAVQQGPARLVVKQSLPRLNVEAEWLAPVTRILTEAAAMKLIGQIADDAVPQVTHIDSDRYVIAMENAPPTWVDWKSELMQGRASGPIASRVGALTGMVHRSTLGDAAIRDEFSDPHSFEQLRLDPYYGATARNVPAVSSALRELADRLRGQRRVLIHGDLSPKNILVEPDSVSPRAWLIDFEVATYGDPAFDLAFLLTHLTMKALHRPQDAAAFDAAALSFADAYEAAAGPELTPDWAYVNSHVGALLLARVHGKSPVEYLDAEARERAELLAHRLLHEATLSVSDLHAVREELS